MLSVKCNGKISYNREAIAKYCYKGIFFLEQGKEIYQENDCFPFKKAGAEAYTFLNLQNDYSDCC